MQLAEVADWQMIAMAEVKDFKDAINDSIWQFNNIVKPVLVDRYGGEFISVEGDEHPVCKLLDMVGGVDIIWLVKNSIIGIANRIQVTNKNWATFTVRKTRESGAATEFEKRCKAINSGIAIYPQLTLQSYINFNGELLGYGLVATKDLFDVISCGDCRVQYTGKEQIGQASFYVVGFSKIKELGKKIIIWDRDNQSAL